MPGIAFTCQTSFSSGTSAFPQPSTALPFSGHILQNFLFPVLSIALSLHPAFFKPKYAHVSTSPERHGHIVAFFPITKTKPGWRWADFRSTFSANSGASSVFMKKLLKTPTELTPWKQFNTWAFTPWTNTAGIVFPTEPV